MAFTKSKFGSKFTWTQAIIHAVVWLIILYAILYPFRILDLWGSEIEPSAREYYTQLDIPESAGEFSVRYRYGNAVLASVLIDISSDISYLILDDGIREKMGGEEVIYASDIDKVWKSRESVDHIYSYYQVLFRDRIKYLMTTKVTSDIEQVTSNDYIIQSVQDKMTDQIVILGLVRILQVAAFWMFITSQYARPILIMKLMSKIKLT